VSSRFAKILSPLDLDEVTFPALKVAEGIAARSGGTIYLLHVVPSEEFALLQHKYRPWEAGGADVEAACRVARRKLEQTAQERIGGGVPYEVLTRVGDAAEMVLNVEKELDADLVVVGVRGERSFFVDRVIHDSFCPVLTVPEVPRMNGSGLSPTRQIPPR
jgi:nucleotide-binding universal stress UspA family protein